MSATFVGLVGGVLLIVGLAVPLVGLLVAIHMAGALIFVRDSYGVFVDAGGYEFVLVIGTLGAMFLGACANAVDRLIPSATRRSAVAA